MFRRWSQVYGVAVITVMVFFSSVGSEELIVPPQPLTPLQEFHHPHPHLLDGFGHALAASHPSVLIAAPYTADRGRETGIVYLFDKEGQVRQTFHSPISQDGALFGWSVALLGRDVVIGAPQGRDTKSTQTGAVYVFDGKTGNLRMTLVNPHPMTGTFGHALAISDDWIVVGDPLASTPSTFYTGAVYVFDKLSGTLLRTLYPPDLKRQQRGNFGHAVAIAGHRVFVAAPHGDPEHRGAGVVYSFNGETGGRLKMFRGSPSNPSSFFGWSISAKGDVLLVGAFGHQGRYREEGVAYVFDSRSGTLSRRLAPPVPTERGHFGKVVAHVSTLLAISAPGDRITEFGKIEGGAVYLVSERKPSFFREWSGEFF